MPVVRPRAAPGCLPERGGGVRVNINTFVLSGYTVRIANDQRPGSPECWKTSIDHDIWTPGVPTVGQAVQDVVDTLEATLMNSVEALTVAIDQLVTSITFDPASVPPLSDADIMRLEEAADTLTALREHIADQEVAS